MEEVRFRGRDQFRAPEARRLAIMFGGGSVATAASFARMGKAELIWGLAALLALGVAGVYLRLRAATTVGPAGITVVRFGAGRTYPWHRIQWFDVRTVGSTQDALLHLTDGRRRTLPGLHRSALYPSPSFRDDIEQVYAWWEASTHPDARVRPPLKFRDRHPWGFAWLVTVPAVLAVTLLLMLATGSLG